MSIKIQKLNKTYKVAQRKAGMFASLKSLLKSDLKQIQAVKDISFRIEQGEIVGFIGPNGAGKTTTIKMMSGLLYPTHGEIEVLGYVPQQRKNEFLKQIALVLGQKNQLWWDLPAIETFKLNKEIYGLSDTEFQERLSELTDMLGVGEVIEQQVRKMSLGQRMKCELIAALLHRPRILFLDEPTIGLDIVTQKKVRSFIKEYNKKYQATIILTSHYMDDVREICERIILINHGDILYDGKLEEMLAKYGGYKTIKIIFNEVVPAEKLNEYGEILHHDGQSVTLKVKQDQAAEVTSNMMKKHKVDDIDIAEPALEDIIEKYF